MIPHKLRLTNFMCYRSEQSLDFAGLHLACLAGENGHGKSALLDAMTWALWGRARARRDDELITLGESDMAVEFEFGLGDQRFKVLRQRSKKRGGQSDLHLHVWDPKGGRVAAAGRRQFSRAPAPDHPPSAPRLRDLCQLRVSPPGSRRLFYDQDRAGAQASSLRYPRAEPLRRVRGARQGVGPGV
jgi:hypothetical protein